jgi:zinc protease
VQVYQLMRAEIDRIGDELVPESELTARKAVLIGGFGRSIETTSGLAGQISTLALYGLPPERLGAYVSDVSSVTPEQARAAAARYFDPDQADVVIVGDAQHFYDAFRRARRDAERIPASDLNLDEESLR